MMRRGAFVRWPVHGNVLEALREGRLEIGAQTLLEPDVWITAPGAAKPAEQAFLLPGTTPILDNNFFVHREVLAWKYLQIAPCKDENGHRHCEPQDFGTLVPQDHFSMPVRMELVGEEKVTIRGAERELLRLNLRGEGLDWALWLDDGDKFKLIKVGIPSENTEVVRD